MKPLVITAYSTVSAAGVGREALRNALFQRKSGLRACDFLHAPIATYIGRVPGIESEPLPRELERFEGRNNRLAQLALQTDNFAAHVESARKRYGAERVAIIIGTSTSGVLETEAAYRARDGAGKLPQSYRYQYTHSLYATSDFVRHALSLAGPAATVSTACSSSAKVFASAARMIAQGVCDCAVVGGVDSLCLNTLYGFSSLELVATEPCRPCAADRAGISIGEAAGFALLERPEHARTGACLALLGYGESADAYHMSTPHPDGLGATMAMRQALERADLKPEEIDYINLHGTASQVNDAMEDKAVAQVFGTETPCSGTKGWTGHALGAAGITEAIIACMSIEHQLMPGTLNTSVVDPTFSSRILIDNLSAPVKRVLSNSFGFGGSNCSLVLGMFG